MSASRVFEPFWTSKDEGMGLGLAICRRLVTTHGGRIWIEQENQQEQGVAFRFTIPIAD